jgi:hypothetical protein
VGAQDPKTAKVYEKVNQAAVLKEKYIGDRTGTLDATNLAHQLNEGGTTLVLHKTSPNVTSNDMDPKTESNHLEDNHSNNTKAKENVIKQGEVIGDGVKSKGGECSNNAVPQVVVHQVNAPEKHEDDFKNRSSLRMSSRLSKRQHM